MGKEEEDLAMALALSASLASNSSGGRRAPEVVACPRCTFENPPGSRRCEMCDGELRPSAVAGSSPYPAPREHIGSPPERYGSRQGPARHDDAHRPRDRQGGLETGIDENAGNKGRNRNRDRNRDRDRDRNGGDRPPRDRRDTGGGYSPGSTAVARSPPAAARQDECPTCGKRISALRRGLGLGVVVANGRTFCSQNCLRCAFCHEPLLGKFTLADDGEMYHAQCFTELFHPDCRRCGRKVSSSSGRITYLTTPFWGDALCSKGGSREHPCDAETAPRCTGCERVEPLSNPYLTLSDGRHLCSPCASTALFDPSTDGPPLRDEILAFLRTLGIEVPHGRDIPFLLVESPVLNEQSGHGASGHGHHNTRGLTIAQVSRIYAVSGSQRRRGAMGVTSGWRELRPRATVSAILVLYGLPREVTAEVLAHEFMHAHFRLHHFPHMASRVEEGICQLMSFLFLTRDNPPSDEASIRKFCLHKLETSPDEDYGEGFREAYTAYLEFGLIKLLETVHATGRLPRAAGG